MAKSWQDVATQQAELISSRLRELLSSGLGLLRSELGVDLGLKPELYPSWVILLTAVLGLLLIAVSWAAACSGLFGGRKRRAGASEECIDGAKASLTKAVKAEEQKKKSKKKPVEKKSQPNGRTLPEPHGEVKVEGIQKQSPDIKTEKAKKKKKSKTEVKQAQTVSSPDGKEPDEGAWETKVSNREKRQQRRKEKVPGDGSGSPGGADPPVRAPVEPPITTAAPVSLRKSRVESLHVKPGKGDAIISQVSASWSEVSAVNGGGWTDMAMKLPAQLSSSDGEKWPSILKEAGHRNPEPQPWGQDTEGSWTALDGRLKTDLSSASFTVLGLNATGGEAVPAPAADLQRDSGPAVDDEWSGFNGMEGVDPSSDWNAPSELWGNYEEPQPESPAPSNDPAPEAVKVSDDEKDKGDNSGGASGKSKKKKKKKKKQDEAGATLQESEEPEKEAASEGEELRKPVQETAQPETPAALEERISVPESASQKPSSQVPQRLSEPEPLVPPAKQSSTPPSSQKKSEENWESPKQVQKKKKARRET
ncbi:metadherin a isoform X1 [Megalops cyprinoides]|uniref:metadherin a isoform X1 n=1 Tax=Megalops cyprinoides TaxID=118141 RepID=UPI00186565FE|nr:metadherin a isoform X1 [Megalops cyprinoides]